MPTQVVPITELPQSFFEAVAQDLQEFGVGFLRIEDTRDGQDAVLLGSGTLVKAAGKHAILTAHHVLEVLPRTGRLGLILAPTVHQHTIDTTGLIYKEIARGSVDQDGPDLGAVILSPQIAAAIAARKIFYNLDLRREKLLSNPPERDYGVWFVNGFVAEGTRHEPGRDQYTAIKAFFNLTGAGGPDTEATEVGDYDYYAFPVTYGAQSVAPRSFQGMSGGGLWQVPISKDEQGVWRHKTPWLSGVVFYQEETQANHGAVKCHGRRSVYKVAYDTVAHEQP
jgi:hypothetical protein